MEHLLAFASGPAMTVEVVPDLACDQRSALFADRRCGCSATSPQTCAKERDSRLGLGLTVERHRDGMKAKDITKYVSADTYAG
jgi:hypothetical protein